MAKSKTHLITSDLSPAEKRELHISALSNEIRQPLERLLPVLGLKSPQMRAGQWRLTDVLECPSCGEKAPLDRPDLVPWLFGAREIRCTGGCEIDAARLLELFCDGNEEIDAALSQLSVGRPKLKRFYVFELLLSEAEGDRPAKYRRVIGDGMMETLRRLEPSVDSVVRGVCVDAPDLMTAQTIVRGDSQIPWCPKLPLDHRGRLTRIDWSGAPLSQVELELARRLAI